MAGIRTISGKILVIFIDGEFKKYITYTSKGYYEVYDLNQDNTYYVMQPGLFGDSAVKVSYNSEEASWGYRKYEGFHKVWVAVTPKENEDDADDSHTQFYEWHENGSQGLTEQDYQDALVSSDDDSITTAIDNLSASGTTRASYGMEMANKVFENNPNTPLGGTLPRCGFSSQMASRDIAAMKPMKRDVRSLRRMPQRTPTVQRFSLLVCLMTPAMRSKIS